MKIRCLIFAAVLLAPACFPVALTAIDAHSNGPAKAQELAKPKPPVEIPSSPAESANPGQNPVKPAESVNPGKSAAPSNPETPVEPYKPADSLKNGDPAAETPSGTKPADPADPGENPANPAEPDSKAKPDNIEKDKKDKTDKDIKEKKDNSGKGGKSGPALPSGGPAPQVGGASLAPAAGGMGSGFIGGILSAGTKEEKEEKKEKTTRPTPEENTASSETVKAGAPVRSSTQAISAEMLYSAGKGSRIAIIGFEGDGGAEFAAHLSAALSSDFKVYNPKILAVKKIDSAAVNRVSARKIAADLGIEYLVAGRVSKKTDTLSIISVFLRDGASGDVKMSDNHNIRSSGDLKSAAENAAVKIKERVTP